MLPYTKVLHGCILGIFGTNSEYTATPRSGMNVMHRENVHSEFYGTNNLVYSGRNRWHQFFVIHACSCICAIEHWACRSLYKEGTKLRKSCPVDLGGLCLSEALHSA